MFVLKKRLVHTWATSLEEYSKFRQGFELCSVILLTYYATPVQYRYIRLLCVIHAVRHHSCRLFHLFPIMSFLSLPYMVMERSEVCWLGVFDLWSHCSWSSCETVWCKCWLLILKYHSYVLHINAQFNSIYTGASVIYVKRFWYSVLINCNANFLLENLSAKFRCFSYSQSFLKYKFRSTKLTGKAPF